MKRIVGLVGGLFCLVLGPGQAVGQQAHQRTLAPGRQIVTAEQIRRAGLVRLGDLFQLIDGWTSVTIDGLHEQAHPSGFAPVQAGRWRLLVDGQPAGLSVFGAQDLNRLSIPLYEVAYVEVRDGPGLHEGALTTRGMLHIHTRTPENGTTLQGAYWTGNEAGDPGPLRYLDDAPAPNVDHLGPDVAATVERAGAWGWARLAALTRIHFPTDPALLPRIAARSDAYPKTEMLASSVRAHFRTGAETYHHVAVTFSGSRDYVFMDPAAREVPTNVLYGRAGLNGRIPLRERTHLRYRAGYALNRLGERANPQGFDPDWRMDRLTASADVHHEADAYTMRVGAGGERDRLRTTYRLRRAARQQGWLYGRGQLTNLRPVQPGAAVQVSTDGDGLAWRGLLDARWTPTGSFAATGALAYAERAFADDHPLAYWTRQGYGMLDELGVDYTAARRSRSSRTVTANVNARAVLAPEITARGGVFYRAFTDLALTERSALQYDPDEKAFGGPVQMQSDAAGQVLGGRARLQAQWTPWLRQRVAGVVQGPVAGDASFRAAWRAQSAFQVRSRLAFTPVSSFSMSAALAYRSPTYWADYAGAERLSGGAYQARVPAFWTLNTSARKTLWQRRLRASVIVRNVLHRPYRLHPLGASFPLQLMVQIEARLGW